MNDNNVKLGKRIADLRKKMNLSQQRLAARIGLSRTALSQMERGERKISAEELRRLSDVMKLSVDVLFDESMEPTVILEKKKTTGKKPSIRINVPIENAQKFKEVLIYILNMVGAKPNIGETVLYKLLYFIDFDYYEKFEEQLIGAKYIKNKFGPTPVEFKKIVDKMIKDGEIDRIEIDYYHYKQKKYLPRRKADLRALNAQELVLINDVLRRLSDMSADQISDYSHKDVPWLAADSNRIIEYETVFYRTKEYSQRGEDG